MARWFMALLVLVVAAADPAKAYDYTGVPESNELTFRVVRNGSEMGFHRVTFTQLDDDRLQVDIEVEMRVRLAFITVFRYEFACREIWDQGRLDSLDCMTNDDGKDLYVEAERLSDGQLRIEGTRVDGETVVADALPSSYWNIALMGKDVVLNAQNGMLQPVTITQHETETITARGREIEATRYELIGTLRLEIWYDQNDQWVKFRFNARGQDITYELIDPENA